MKMKYEEFIKTFPERVVIDSLLNHYKSRLRNYKLKNEEFQKKYGMNFEEFSRRNVVKDRNFSWQVEADAMEWEHVIEGIRFCSEKIRELEEWKLILSYPKSKV